MLFWPPVMAILPVRCYPGRDPAEIGQGRSSGPAGAGVVCKVKKSNLTGNSAERTLTQYGALCYRMAAAGGAADGAAGGVEILLITSRDTGRWVLPKGWPMPGRTGPQCALREAFEEAGVEGRLCDGLVGVYPYVKTLAPDAGVTCVVSVYAVAVDRLRHSFPERGQRARTWFPQDEAARRVAEPELAEIIRGFVPPLPAAAAAKDGARRVDRPANRA